MERQIFGSLISPWCPCKSQLLQWVCLGAPAGDSTTYHSNFSSKATAYAIGFQGESQGHLLRQWDTDECIIFSPAADIIKEQIKLRDLKWTWLICISVFSSVCYSSLHRFFIRSSKQYDSFQDCHPEVSFFARNPNVTCKCTCTVEDCLTVLWTSSVTEWFYYHYALIWRFSVWQPRNFRAPRIEMSGKCSDINRPPRVSLWA